ncbi:hypothetical protein [Bradyrhizobium sp. G127]|uniref:hypothetical protein n=1 Tax=Bradyrhizobium sp. G127 TaxID=2904800 RepID=UPI001F47B6F0|nr:hypothetical protein [Bradyrhizobium sp. G127]MCF2525402.1 hypothetical protein [Bradyrhizobium sp. G127]
MSPATSRRYSVRFVDWTLYETVVLAEGEDAAIAKAQALYHTDGLSAFTFKTVGDEGWEAEILEDQS